MQIVILAAGRGTRMEELTDSTPKPMLEIKNKPILAYKLEALPKEIDEVIFVVGYLGDQIKKYFGDSYVGKKILYVEQGQLNGSGGALNLTKGLLQENFLVMNGDDLYSRKDMEKIMEEKLAIAAFPVDEPEKFGVLELDEKANLHGIIEKPKITGIALANIGLYKLDKRVFNYPMNPSVSGELYLTDAVTGLAKDCEVKIIPATIWQPIGTKEDLKKAESTIEKFT